MSDLRTEAGLLLDVLADRLTALKNATSTDLTGPTNDRAGSATPEQRSKDAAAPHQHPSRLDAEPPAGVPGPCRACGHDPAGAVCPGCPLCALLAVLRGGRPDVAAGAFDGVLDGALKAVIGVRMLLGEPPADPTAGRPDDQNLPQLADPGPRGSGWAAAVPRRPAERIHIS